jgi:hypothetical protein
MSKGKRWRSDNASTLEPARRVSRPRCGLGRDLPPTSAASETPPQAEGSRRSQVGTPSAAPHPSAKGETHS